jgi:hypothetical protein
MMFQPCFLAVEKKERMPRRLSRASVVRVFHGAVQPHLDQMQHAPINDPARYRL